VESVHIIANPEGAPVPSEVLSLTKGAAEGRQFPTANGGDCSGSR
jgi:hypothetical protein